MDLRSSFISRFLFAIKKYICLKELKYLLYVLFIYTPLNNLQGQELKVIAYNVEFGKNTTPKTVSALLQSEKADIICFNEVPGQGWTKKVGKYLGLAYSYEGTIASANHETEFKDKTKNYYGKYKSILSRYRLKDKHEIILDGDGWSPSSVVAASLKIPKTDKSIQIYSLHVPSGKSHPETSKVEHLSRIIGNGTKGIEKIILAGDFNDVQDSKSLQYLYDIGFSNSWQSLDLPLNDKTTYITKKIEERSVIDHILFKGVTIKSAAIIEEEIEPQSDHKPVWSLFVL
ncbi:endonuclease/exonuclease/phosphatase family protein [Arenibacter sp. BSSL-BM3]|uniref:Endonuclease/exonuclease/phosphatase family protein n=1 Tax=Arenibacter arenosicollis TaxID=2762274 RepID=A0ABR7QMX2_9FLAO|nr:endonuclease/exonuclease/phosphatase family protein [Arenibacter arenosicollis]MBC8768547.1 endonuclease/exonuclease/phosphatase family protein [Arenibacter arenosicollis]